MSAIPEAAVIWKLKSVSAINSAVGGRIYPRSAPQGADLPYIVIDRPPGQINNQLSTGPQQLVRTPITIYCIGATYAASRTVARLIPPYLNPSSFTASVQWNGTWIDHCVVNSTYEASAPPNVADEVGYPIEAIDCVLYHFDCDSTG